MRRRRTVRPATGLASPARAIASAFVGAVAVGTALLSLPLATESGEGASLVDALFTATSAVCVTGLVTVDTGSYWSGFGEGVVLLLIQAGGLGIMTLATLIVLLLSRRLGVRARLVAQTETKSLSATEVRRVVRNVVLYSLAVEAVATTALTLRFALRYDEPLHEAAYSGLFHAVSAFNNAGFGLYPDNLVRYVGDPWVNTTVVLAVVIGGLGYPVVFELARSWRRPRSWSVLTRITVVVTGVLLVLGPTVLLALEHDNPGTMGPLGEGDKALAAVFAGVMPRTAGFNSIDIAALRPESLFFTDVLMFIGGGSAGTAGGIKVTTFGLLAYVLWAEMRGDPEVHVGRRRVPAANQRQALAVALLGVAIVTVASLVMLAVTDAASDLVVFETVSAFGTVGLSAGLTADLPTGAHLVLVALMFVGRVGPLTLASGLALRERSRRHRLPEERIIVG